MFKKVLVIINPMSGKPTPVLRQISQALATHDVSWEVLLTQKSTLPEQLSEEDFLTQFDCVAVYGGDGTLHQVAAQLMQSRFRLPMYPLAGGTSNTFVRELGIAMDISTAIEQLISGKLAQKSIDTATLNDTFFLNAAAIGSVAQFNADTKSEHKSVQGFLAYVPVLAQKLSVSTPFSLTIEAQGVTHTHEASFVVITNGSFEFVDGLQLLKDASLTDGKLKVSIMPPMSLEHVAQAASAAVTKQAFDSVVTTYSLTEFTIHMQPQQHVLIDDLDVMCGQLQAKVQPASLDILVPA